MNKYIKKEFNSILSSKEYVENFIKKVDYTEIGTFFNISIQKVGDCKYFVIIDFDIEQTKKNDIFELCKKCKYCQFNYNNDKSIWYFIYCGKSTMYITFEENSKEAQNQFIKYSKKRIKYPKCFEENKNGN